MTWPGSERCSIGDGHEWVIEPAGLAATGFGRLDEPVPDFAWGYLPDGRPNVGHLPPVGGPDGGIVTTADDLHRFFAWLKRGDSISEAARRALFERVSAIGDGEDYGRGFEIIAACGRDWCGHTGGEPPGVSAKAVFSRQSDSSMVVLCNRQSVAYRAFRLVIVWLESAGLPPDYPLPWAGAAERPT